MFDDSGGSSTVPTTDMDITERSLANIEDKLDSKLGTPSAYSSILSRDKVSAECLLRVISGRPNYWRSLTSLTFV